MTLTFCFQCCFILFPLFKFFFKKAMKLDTVSLKPGFRSPTILRCFLWVLPPALPLYNFTSSLHNCGVSFVYSFWGYQWRSTPVLGSFPLLTLIEETKTLFYFFPPPDLLFSSILFSLRRFLTWYSGFTVFMVSSKFCAAAPAFVSVLIDVRM